MEHLQCTKLVESSLEWLLEAATLRPAFHAMYECTHCVNMTSPMHGMLSHPALVCCFCSLHSVLFVHVLTEVVHRGFHGTSPSFCNLKGSAVFWNWRVM